MASGNFDSNTPGVPAVTADNTAATGPGSNGVYAISCSAADSAVYGEHRGTGIGLFGRGGPNGGEGAFGQTASGYSGVYGKNTNTLVSRGVEYFGYWADAFAGTGCGDYISETTANGSNLVVIRQGTVLDLTTKLSEARQRGTKAMVNIELLVFGDDGHLRTDWQNQWTTNVKTPIVSNGFEDTVAAFYLRDEPYTHGTSRDDLNALKAQVNADFPCKPTAAILYKDEILSAGFDSSYVCMLDWVGFDWYAPWSDHSMQTLIGILRKLLRDDQRMIAVLAAAVWPNSYFTDASDSGQNYMIQSNINMWQQEVMSDAKYILVMPFLWQSFNVTTGTQDLPRVKARLFDMAYSLLHDVKNYIPTSTSPGVTGESSSGTGVVGISHLAGRLDEVEGAPGGAGIVGSNDQLYGRGVIGQADGEAGIGVFGTGGDTGVWGMGTNAGLQGDSTEGYGVLGSSTNGVGVWGSSDNRPGLFGTSINDNGVLGVSGNVGVQARNSNALGGNEAYLGAGGFAGDFHGNVSVIGTLTKSSGGFRIDHPGDPARKYLSHSFVESPDMKNIYDGIAVLDDAGEAEVELPSWFDALNKDFRYQLTCLGGYAPVYIAQEMRDNRFKIAGGIPDMKVCWQATGVRQDPWANANRLPVEEAKPADEQGYYLAPELYGESDERSIRRARYPQQQQWIEQMEERRRARRIPQRSGD